MAGEVAGVDILLYVDFNPGGVADWRLVGGQRGATMRRTTEVADAKHKSSGAWPNRVQTFLDWGITADAVVIENDVTLAHLRNAWRTRADVKVQVRTPPDIEETGMAVIADFSMNAPHT